MSRMLITGATGFLGGAVVAEMMEQDRASELLLLVRASTPTDGLKRMAERLRSFSVPASRIASLKADQIVVGDIAQLNSFISDSRLQDVTSVINCAAVTSFGNNPKIWPVNVDATTAFADAARRWPKLKRFLHVGTAMACGVQSNSPVLESYEPGGTAQHLVPYTKSKAAVEMHLRNEMPELPLVVARPSIVVGHSRLGCQPSPSIFWVFRIVKALGEFLCGYDDRIDVIPVDYCAQALITLATKPTVQYDRYHVSAGEARSNTMREIDIEFSRSLGVEPAKEYRQISFDKIVRREQEFPGLFGNCDSRLLLLAMKLYGAFASLNLLFDNQRLLAEGISLSPHFTDYVGHCVRTSLDSTVAEQMKVDFK